MKSPIRHILPVIALWLASQPLRAQVGEHRNDFSVGVSAGYVMSTVGFTPKVPQDQLGGFTTGLTFRYTSEKYFNSICAIVGEVNLVQSGWKERIWDIEDQPVVNPDTQQPENYSRRLNYLQVPVLARLGWGRERRGLQCFFQLGPQFGYLLSEHTDANFDLNHPNVNDRVSHVSGPDIDYEGQIYPFSNMYHMPVEHKFDYGIAGGLGLEFSNKAIGHLMIEGRYYYGLGDLYGNTKRDYFARSYLSNIVVKLTYMFDITKTKNPKIK